MATIVASLALVSYSTVGLWMPLFLSQQHHWSTAQYGSFYIWWALFATTGFWAGGWMIDRFGRRTGFAILLIEAAIFMTIWIFATDMVALWLLGMAWSWGFIGVWGPVTAYTAEMYPTRIRGVGNGFSWAVAFLVGAVLWPFVSVWLREATGSFVAAFLLIPVILLIMAGDHLVLQPGACAQGSRPDRGLITLALLPADDGRRSRGHPDRSSPGR